MPITTISAAGIRVAATPPPRTWVQRRLVDPFLSLLKAGLAPSSLALTAGLGVAFGLAPTFGVTTLISTAVALRLRLNLAAMQLVSHLMGPFQLLLLLPLLRWGATLLGHGRQVANLTLQQIRHSIKTEGWGTVLHLLWRAELGALLIWAVAAVPVVLGLYVALRPVFRHFIQQHEMSNAEGLNHEGLNAEG